MKHRTFGVEVECGHPDGPEGVAQILREAGLHAVDYYSDRRSGYWHVGADGSGVEARTPILRGPEGFKELRRGITAIRDAGGFVTIRDGMHVHHGVPDLRDDKDAIIRLVQSWRQNARLIHAFLAERRYGARAYNPDWTDAQFRQLVNDSVIGRSQQFYNPRTRRFEGTVSIDQCGPRGSLNIWPIRQKGTVELRAHEGTLDPNIAEAWVRFGQRFVEAVANRKRAIPSCHNPEELLKRVKCGKRATTLLLSKPLDPAFR